MFGQHPGPFEDPIGGGGGHMVLSNYPGLAEQFEFRRFGPIPPYISGGPRSSPGNVPTSLWGDWLGSSRAPKLQYTKLFMGKWSVWPIPAEPVKAVEQMRLMFTTPIDPMLTQGIPPAATSGRPGRPYQQSWAEMERQETSHDKNTNPATRPGPAGNFIRPPAVPLNVGEVPRDEAGNELPIPAQEKDLILTTQQWANVIGLGVRNVSTGEAPKAPSPSTVLGTRVQQWSMRVRGAPNPSQDPLFLALLRPVWNLASMIRNVREMNGVVLRTLWATTDYPDAKSAYLSRHAAYVYTVESSPNNLLMPAGWKKGYVAEYQLTPDVKRIADQLIQEINHATGALRQDIIRVSDEAKVPLPDMPPEDSSPRSGFSWSLFAVQAGLLLGMGYLAYTQGFFGKVTARRGRGTLAIPKIPHPKRGEKIATFRVPT
jgi:hypothetical protein